jgi:hypothetical protein
MNDTDKSSPPPTFKPVSEGIVKSIKQRQLARYWERLRGAHLLPLWSEVDPAEIAASRDHLCVMEVKREPSTVRYRIREHGDKLTEYYGSACAGRHLDEFMTPTALAALTAMYAQAVQARRPVYSVAPITDGKGRSVIFERLLLPFTVSGSSVEIVLTSLETISIEGAFEHFKVLEPSQRKVFAGFQGIIEAPAHPAV